MTRKPFARTVLFGATVIPAVPRCPRCGAHAGPIVGAGRFGSRCPVDMTAVLAKLRGLEVTGEAGGFVFRAFAGCEVCAINYPLAGTCVVADIERKVLNV